MWKLCAEGQTWDAVTGGCIGDATIYNWQAALLRAPDVNDGLAGENLGYDDWRLPNAAETAWLLDRSVAAPALDQTLFADDDGEYWSNSPGPADSRTAFQSRAVSVTSGLTERREKTSSFKVRLVRGGVPLQRWHADLDGDGFGNPDEYSFAVLQPDRFVGDDRDCNDTRNDINPSATEIPDDGIDNNCNGRIDEEDMPS